MRQDSQGSPPTPQLIGGQHFLLSPLTVYRLSPEMFLISYKEGNVEQEYSLHELWLVDIGMFKTDMQKA